MAAALAACNSVMKLAASPMLPKRPRFAARLALVVLGGLGHEGSLLVAAAGGGAAACAVGAAGMGGRGNEESRGAGAWE